MQISSILPEDNLVLPILSWKKNTECVYLECNNQLSLLFGLKCPDKIFGITDYDISCKAVESAEIFQEQDKRVMVSAHSIKILEINQYADGQLKVFLAKKSPLHDSNNWVIGTKGQAVDITSLLYKFDLLIPELAWHKSKAIRGSFLLSHNHTGIDLSNRQLECLFLILRGMTAKQIARRLSLSERTVHDYLEQLKVKFNVHTKTELTEKAIENGFINIIPEHLFTRHLQFLPK